MSEKDLNYKVVFNSEGRYSIWPDYKEIPLGWTAEGTTGNKQYCLDRISIVWTDMRPKSLRDSLDS
ncbi:MAG: MbtH family NRPS accessory protein [Pseudomonadota bacterium]